jgi:hypothetical protein
MVRLVRGDESVASMQKPDLFKVPYELADTITASTTLNRTHLGKLLPTSSGSAIVLTVPADTTSVAFIEGETFAAYQYGVGALSFAAANGVTIRAPVGLGASTQYAIIGVIRLPTQNEWLFFGSGA